MLRLAPPAAVLLDVGDTLLVEERFDLEAGIAAAVGQSATVPALANAFRADLALNHRSQHELSLAAWLQQHVPALATEFVDSIEDRVWPAVVSLAPAPGALAVVTRLASDGVRMAAISNAAFSSHCLSRELERRRFGSYLAFVISSADVGRRKPHPEIFRQALGRLGVDASQVWFIGDTLAEDVAGAAAIGLECFLLAAVAPLDELAKCCRIIANWSEFSAVYATVAKRSSNAS